MKEVEFELKGLKEEVNTIIAVLVNSGYTVYWKIRKEGNTKKKVFVVSKGGEET